MRLLKRTLLTVLLLAVLTSAPSTAAVNVSAQSSVQPSSPLKTPAILHLDAHEYVADFTIICQSGGLTTMAVEVAIFQNVNAPFNINSGYFQRVHFQTFEPTPTSYRIDAYGNVYAQYSLSFRGVFTITAHVKMTELGSLVFLQSKDVKGLNEIPVGIRDLYTVPEPLIESSSPLIISKANELAAGKTDVYTITQQVFNFVYSNIKYKVMKEPKGAIWALQHGEGDCSEHSSLMVALLRALGIPARINAGFGSKSEIGSFKDAHAWVEVFMPSIGWIPFDPTWNIYSGWRHIALLRHCNEVAGPRMYNYTVYKGPTPTVDLSLTVNKLSFSPFSDQLFIGYDNFLVFARSLMTGNSPIPSSNVTIYPSQSFNCSIFYSGIYIQLTNEFRDFITVIDYAEWSTFPPSSGKTVISGTSLLFYLPPILKSSSNLEYAVNSTFVGSLPTLVIYVSLHAAGGASLMVVLYCIPILSLVLIMVAVVGLGGIVLYLKRKSSEKK